MSRLNTVMQLVTDLTYDHTFQSLCVTSPNYMVAVNRQNELLYLHTSFDSKFMPTAHAIPKEEVVQIVAGFSEIA